MSLPTAEQLHELFVARRSVRGFDPEKEVPHSVIEQILDMARQAPSGGNGQPWEFIVIRDAETRNKIADLYLRQLQDKKELELAVRGYVKMPGDGFRHAPVHILVIGDPRTEKAYPVRTMLDKGERHFITGLANATYAIHLAARVFGLGSQYMSDVGSPYMGTMIKVMLAIPDPYEVYELVPIGYPKKFPSPAPRRPLDEIVHKERYEARKYRTDQQMNEFLMGQSRLGSYGLGKTNNSRSAAERSPEEIREMGEENDVK